MKKQTLPRFAHLQYQVLYDLDITITEYWYLDMVYQLSRDGWCYKSLSNVAVDMKMTKNGVVKMRDRLIAKGFIKKSIKGYVKTEVAYNSVYRMTESAYNLVTNRTTKYNAAVQLSGTKNNNENNIDNKGLKSKNKERIRTALKTGDWSHLKRKPAEA